MWFRLLKPALTWFANSLRLDWEPKGVAVTVVSPLVYRQRSHADAQKRLRHARPGERGSGGGGDPPRSGEGQKPHRLPHRFQPGPASAGQSATVWVSSARNGTWKRGSGWCASAIARPNIAIIGSGIAGLTCAWRLAGHHQVTLFEAGATPGGHTATVDVATPQGTWAIDTGFIVRCLTRKAIAHLSARSLLGLLMRWVPAGDRRAKNADELLGPQPGQRPGIQRPQPDLAFRPAAQSAEAGLLGTAERDRPLQPPGETGADRGAGSRRDAGELHSPPPFFTFPFFAQRARQTPHIFSADGGRPSGRRRCSATCVGPLPLFLRFFENHGLLDIRDRPQWYVVPGGSREYVRALLARLGDRLDLRLNAPVQQVDRHPAGVTLRLASGRRVARRSSPATPRRRSRR